MILKSLGIELVWGRTIVNFIIIFVINKHSYVHIKINLDFITIQIEMYVYLYCIVSFIIK